MYCILRCINQLNIYITGGYEYTKTATQTVFSFDGSAMSTRQGGRTTVVFRAEAVFLRATGVSMVRCSIFVLNVRPSCSYYATAAAYAQLLLRLFVL